jgi:hypothetical protein
LGSRGPSFAPEYLLTQSLPDFHLLNIFQKGRATPVLGTGAAGVEVGSTRTLVDPVSQGTPDTPGSENAAQAGEPQVVKPNLNHELVPFSQFSQFHCSQCRFKSIVMNYLVWDLCFIVVREWFIL